MYRGGIILKTEPRTDRLKLNDTTANRKTAKDLLKLCRRNFDKQKELFELKRIS